MNVRETVAHGCYASGFEAVLELLVDDGVASRRNRKMLLDESFPKLGIGVAPAIRNPLKT